MWLFIVLMIERYNWDIGVNRCYFLIEMNIWYRYGCYICINKLIYISWLVMRVLE